MLRIPIWNNKNGPTRPSHFCDVIIDKGRVHLEIKYGRNNYQVMSLEEIEKQIKDEVKKHDSK